MKLYIYITIEISIRHVLNAKVHLNTKLAMCDGIFFDKECSHNKKNLKMVRINIINVIKNNI